MHAFCADGSRFAAFAWSPQNSKYSTAMPTSTLLLGEKRGRGVVTREERERDVIKFQWYRSSSLNSEVARRVVDSVTARKQRGTPRPLTSGVKRVI